MWHTLTTLNFARSAAALFAAALMATMASAQTPPQACPSCNLAGSDYSNQTLAGINLARANLAGANFTGARIESGQGRLTGLLGANLTYANFTGAVVSGADLQYADITCANFINANLTGVVAGPMPPPPGGTCKATFTGATISCSLAAEWSRLDLAGVTTPDCPPRPSPSTLSTSGWICPNTNLSNIATLVYVSTSGADSASCGKSATAPCQSIGQGLKQCTGTSCGVLTYYGVYYPASTIALGSNQSIFGGCLAAGPVSNKSVSIVNAPPGGVPAIAVNGATSAALQNLSIAGSDVPATTANGTASSAVSIAGNANVALNFMEILGGNGGPGAAGKPGGSGISGGGGSGQIPGTNTTCNASGGQGGQQMTAHVNYNAWNGCVTGCTTTCVLQTGTNTCSASQGCSPNKGQGWCTGPVRSFCNGSTAPGGASGGAAAGGGAAYCASTCSFSGPPGTGGTGGASGTCGGGGQASTGITGSYVNGVWTASVSANGVAGGNGSGGGGGGSGQAAGLNCNFIQTGKYTGGAGGGGGAGSCGSSLGTGGQQGGASIALAVIQSTVTLNTVKIVGGAGGVGGIGGNGGSAVAGGTGAGGAAGGGSTGGSGGNGGWGGSGGSGAGGNGGPSLGIAFASTPQASVATTTFYSGLSGGVGDKGSTPSVAGSFCQSPAAALGTPGRVTDYVSFN
jgi:hypothetical protein